MLRKNLFEINFAPLELQPNLSAAAFFINNSLNLPYSLQKIDESKIIPTVIKQTNFKAEVGDITSVTLPLSGGKFLQTYLVGLGEGRPKDSDIKAIIEGFHQTINKNHIAGVQLFLDTPLADLACIKAICTHLCTASYSFDKYFVTTKEEHASHFLSATICTDLHKDGTEIFQNLKPVLEASCIARDLVTEPSNVLYPKKFMERCKELEALGVKITVLDQEKMASEGMGALLAVAQGSDHRPYTVIMEWRGDQDEELKNKTPLALVGKGVTFDSGGINLKTAPLNMKMDMSGAAVVVATMYALAKRKANVNVLGAVGLVENMPSSKSFKPDDVVTSMSGQTIEIDNTDAEGRLVLADVLWYVQTYYNPGAIVDLATLTGAVHMFFADYCAGLFSNDKNVSKNLLQAGQETGELLWELPLAKYYERMNDSHIADIKNRGNGASTITAAQFLQRFIKPGTSWAHIDIAGVAYKDKYTQSTCTKRATGFGVLLLAKFIADHYEKEASCASDEWGM